MQMCFDMHIKTHKDVTGTKEAPCSDCGAVFYLDKARDFHFKSVHSRSELTANLAALQGGWRIQSSAQLMGGGGTEVAPGR